MDAVDRRTGKKNSSRFIEKALWAFIAQMAWNERNARDIRIINQRADYLNREAAGVLECQIVS